MLKVGGTASSGRTLLLDIDQMFGTRGVTATVVAVATTTLLYLQSASTTIIRIQVCCFAQIPLYSCSRLLWPI